MFYDLIQYLNVKLKLNIVKNSFNATNDGKPFPLTETLNEFASPVLQRLKLLKRLQTVIAIMNRPA